MQNAVDAVRELWDFQKQSPAFKDVPVLEKEADVVVWMDEPDENGAAWMTISDQGIGMTEQVITDYFLKVGASFRQSDAWAKQHEAQEDSPIKSRVLRSGRFGIGALAAYLLGDEIEVSTRHVTGKTGLRFNVKLDSEAIELRYDPRLKVGTTIRIPMTKGIYENLTKHFWNVDDWDWYCLKKPSVLRLVGHKRQKLPQKMEVPDAEDKLPVGWYQIDNPAFKGYVAAIFTAIH